MLPSVKRNLWQLGKLSSHPHRESFCHLTDPRPHGSGVLGNHKLEFFTNPEWKNFKMFQCIHVSVYTCEPHLFCGSHVQYLTFTNKHATKFVKIKRCDALLEFTLQEFCLQVQNRVAPYSSNCLVNSHQHLLELKKTICGHLSHVFPLTYLLSMRHKSASC